MLSGCFCLVLCVVCINRSNRVMLLEVGRIAILVKCRSGKKTAREFQGCCWYFLSWSEECIQFVNNLLSYILMVKVKVKSLSRVRLCDPMVYSLLGSPVHGIFRARVLGWVSFSFSRGPSRHRDRTQVSRIAGRCFTLWATREALNSPQLVAQLVKHLPAMQDTWVQSLGWEDPLRRERLPSPVFWPGEFHELYSQWGHKELDTTEQLSLREYLWCICFNACVS